MVYKASYKLLQLSAVTERLLRKGKVWFSSKNEQGSLIHFVKYFRTRILDVIDIVLDILDIRHYLSYKNNSDKKLLVH